MHLRIAILFTAVAGFIVMWSGDQATTKRSAVLISETRPVSEAAHAGCACRHGSQDEAEEPVVSSEEGEAAPDVTNAVTQIEDSNSNLVPEVGALEPTIDAVNPGKNDDVSVLPVPTNLQGGIYRVVSTRGDVRLIELSASAGEERFTGKPLAAMGQTVSRDGTRWHFIRLNEGADVRAKALSQLSAPPTMPQSRDAGDLTKTVRIEFHITLAPAAVPPTTFQQATAGKNSSNRWQNSMSQLAGWLKPTPPAIDEPVEAPRPREARVEMAGELPPTY